MAANYTVDELINLIKSVGYVPTSASGTQGYQDADFLRLINNEISYYIVPTITSIREEFYVTTYEAPIGSTSSFDIPSHAIGSKLRDVLRKDNNGNKFSIARIEPEDIPRFNLNNNYIRGFYIEDNKIIILGNVSTEETIQLKYFRRPNSCVMTSSCGLITNVSQGTGNFTVTITNMTTAFTTSSYLDFINGQPFFNSKGDNYNPTSVTVGGSTTALVFAGTLPTDLAAGDWVCNHGETPVPQIPVEAFPLLAERVVMKIMQSVGDRENFAISKTQVAEAREMLLQVLTDRVEGEDRKIVNTNNFAWRNRRFWIY